MQLTLASVFVAVALASEVAAFPDPAGHQWEAPTATDQRGPCPGLNTLANHGYLPRDGQNFTIQKLIDAAQEGFNVNWDAILIAAKFGLLTSNDVGNIQTMSLGNIAYHGLIEHDASLSRQDFGDGTGDNVHFNETIFSTLANSNPGVDYYDPTSAGTVQFLRLQDSLQNNPLVINTRKEFVLRSRESGLYLSIFGDPLTGIANKTFVNTFFREERLPSAEGWVKPKTLISQATLQNIETTIRAVSNWTLTQNCEPLVLAPGSVVNTAA